VSEGGVFARIVQGAHEMPTITGLVSAGIGIDIGLVAASMQRTQVP